MLLPEGKSWSSENFYGDAILRIEISWFGWVDVGMFVMFYGAYFGF
jgi:hypothetical protein